MCVFGNLIWKSCNQRQSKYIFVCTFFMKGGSAIDLPMDYANGNGMNANMAHDNIGFENDMNEKQENTSHITQL